MFADHHLTVVPDHRGTGDSDRPPDGYTIEELAADMTAVVDAVGCGPMHVVGSSTGGAIAQVMALDHPESVQSITLVSSWAGPEAYFDRQFRVRRSILETSGVSAYTEASALFLFAPEYTVEHSSEVADWIAAAAGGATPPEIMVKRIEMILNHDQRRRLERIKVPCLVVVGDRDICTPLYASRELAGLIPDADLHVLEGGHLIYKETPEQFFAVVDEFICGRP